MHVQCTYCRVGYDVEDLQDTTSLECINCGLHFEVVRYEANSEVATRADDAAEALVPRRSWLIRSGDGDVREVPELIMLQKWIFTGLVTRDWEISIDAKSWKPIGAIGELESFFGFAEEAQDAWLDAATGSIDLSTAQARAALDTAAQDERDEAYEPSSAATATKRVAGRASTTPGLPPPVPPADVGWMLTADEELFEELHPEFAAMPGASEYAHGDSLADRVDKALDAADGVAVLHFSRPETDGVVVQEPQAEVVSAPPAPTVALAPSTPTAPLTREAAEISRPASSSWPWARALIGAGLVAGAGFAAYYGIRQQREPSLAVAPPSSLTPVPKRLPDAKPVAGPRMPHVAGSSVSSEDSKDDVAVAKKLTELPDGSKDAAAVAEIAADSAVGPENNKASGPPKRRRRSGSDTSFAALVKRAEAAADKDNCKRAIPMYKRALAQRPGSVTVLSGLGNCEIDAGRFDSARKRFHAALALSPRHADSLLGLAESHARAGDREHAIAAYRKLLAVYSSGYYAKIARRQLALLDSRRVRKPESYP